MVGATELLLILRARDEASRVLRGLSGNMRAMSAEQKAAIASTFARGQALVGLGVGIGAVGAAGLAFFGASLKTAVEYNQQTALTQTQLDKVNASFNDLKTLGRDIGSTVPVAFEQIQPALYDIFSSIDTNLAGARVLLDSFSHSAVAGQVNLQDSARATIGILNAFHMKVSEVSTVQDVMFQLVRKGVGTYAQFAETIGRATPSASKAGQSVQTLAGMMAFLTRNGLSAAMAAASAARALDAVANPGTEDNFKRFGLSVRNAAGEFKPMTQIIQEMQDKLSTMTAPQRAAALHAMFSRSGGTIQAMRFFNVAVKQADQLKSLTNDMIHSKGAMAGAYDIMFKQPQTQVQLLKNNISILRTEVGDMLVPAFQKVTGWIIVAVKWFNNLSPGVKKAIVYFTLFASIALVIVGVITAVAGIFLILSAGAAAAGTSLAAIVAVAAPVIGVLIAIGVAIYFVIKYHKQIWSFMKVVWHDIETWVVSAWQAIWGYIGPTVTAIYDVIVNVFTAVLNFVVNTFWAVFNAVKGPVTLMYQIVSSIVHAIWIVWTTYLVYIFTVIKTYLTIWYTFWKTYLTFIWTVTSAILKLVWAVVYLFIGLIWFTIKYYWGIIKAATQVMWIVFKYLVLGPIMKTYNELKPIIQAIYNFINGHWDSITKITSTMWQGFVNLIVHPIEEAYNGVAKWIDKIIEKIGSIAGKITAPIKAVTGLLNKLNPLHRNSPSIVDKTQDGWTAMKKATDYGIAQVMASARQTNGYKASLTANFATDSGSNGPVVPGGGRGPGGWSGGGKIVGVEHMEIHTQELDPTKHAADLGWAIAGRLS